MTQLQPLITIGIPTYNRSAQLERLLTTLHPYLLQYARLVEVRVHDNSNDWHALRNRKAATSKGYLYHKHSSNLGYAGNLLSILDNCHSSYLWFLSDDDDVVVSQIEPLIKYLQSLGDNTILMLPFTCDGSPTPINIYSEWNSASSLSDLATQKLPFILFSSFIIPMTSWHQHSRDISPQLNRYMKNAYFQVLLPFVTEAVSGAVYKISYFSSPVINYNHARHGRFRISDLLSSISDVYCFLKKYRFISPTVFSIYMRNSIRAHLLMHLQHKGRLKLFLDADIERRAMILTGLQMTDIYCVLSSIALLVCPPFLVRFILLKRGHTHVN